MQLYEKIYEQITQLPCIRKLITDDNKINDCKRESTLLKKRWNETQQSYMLVYKTTVTEAIDDVDFSYNEVRGINIMIYLTKEERKKIMTKH